MATASGLKWVLGARSETGYVRMANEDRMGFIRTAYGDVYVVSDGMGGYRGGAMAAELTVQTLRDRLAALTPASGSFTEQVRDAFLAANEVVFRRRRADDPDTRDMGATGVALITNGARALVGHVGDSRAYLVSRGALRQLTRDHTRVQKMLDAALLTQAQAAVHPDASMLDRAIGHGATVEVDVSDWFTLKPGDMIMLCSDGLCGFVPDAEIGKVLRGKGSPQTLADRLVDLALGKGGEDNVTVQLVRYGGAVGQPWLASLSSPAIAVPISMLATGLVVWGGAAPALDAAQDRTAALQSELTAARKEVAVLQQQKGDLNKQVATLETQLAIKVASTPPSLAVDALAPKVSARDEKKKRSAPKPPPSSPAFEGAAPAPEPASNAAPARAPTPQTTPAPVNPRASPSSDPSAPLPAD
jgi:serine/threonine protein phosphatase PrpC